MGYNFRTIVFCPRHFYDIEEVFGYLEWKHWTYCPECGSELIHVPIQNRAEELEDYLERGADRSYLEYRERMYEMTKDPEWIEVAPGLYKDCKTIFERLKELREKESVGTE